MGAQDTPRAVEPAYLVVLKELLLLYRGGGRDPRISLVCWLEAVVAIGVGPLQNAAALHDLHET